MGKSDEKYKTWKNLKRFYPYAKKRKKELILYFIFSTLLCIIGAIIPFFSAKQLLHASNGFLNDLIITSLLILTFQFLINISRFASRKFAQIFSREFLKNLQIDLAREFLKIQCKDLDNYSSGVIVDRLSGDANRLSHIVLEINTSLTDFIAYIGVFLAIFTINKILFIYYIIAIIIVFILDKIRIKKYNLKDEKFRRTAEVNTGLVGELVRGVRDLKVLNATESFMETVEEKINQVNQQKYEMANITRKYNLLTSCVRDILDFLLIVLSIFLISKENLSIANFIIVYMYRGRIFNLLTTVSYVLENIKDFNLSAGRVFEIIKSDIFTKEEFGNKHLNKIQGDFEFKNVSFGYNSEKIVLKNISFKIKRNETVSFVGKSGAGKSTVFSLLAKLYDTWDGEILIDGFNIKDLDENSIRGNISIITQNPYIFNMSIKDNLKIVKAGLTDKEMINACKTACIHEFIIDLPNGYDTIIGEGGLMLSGGQRQRLAIARALIQKTEIILFDEATSALDNETQSKIQEAINNMKNKYTILIIAHRLSTVINSDRIIVMDNGKIVNSGNHRKLLKECNIYKKLYEMELKK